MEYSRKSKKNYWNTKIPFLQSHARGWTARMTMSGRRTQTSLSLHDFPGTRPISFHERIIRGILFLS